jgi:hypothetical protein
MHRATKERAPRESRSYSKVLRDVCSQDGFRDPDRHWLCGPTRKQETVDLPGDVATPLYVNS